MKKFHNKKHYYPQFHYLNGEMFLFSSDFNQKLTEDEIQYYLSNFSINSGYMNNIFRLVEYEDGSLKFHEKTHPSYIEALKTSRIKAKDVDIGDTLIDKYGLEYVFLGSFFQRRYTSKRRFFYDKKWKRFISKGNFNSFEEFGDFNSEYANFDKNMEILKKHFRISLSSDVY